MHKKPAAVFRSKLLSPSRSRFSVCMNRSLPLGFDWRDWTCNQPHPSLQNRDWLLNSIIISLSGLFSYECFFVVFHSYLFTLNLNSLGFNLLKNEQKYRFKANKLKCQKDQIFRYLWSEYPSARRNCRKDFVRYLNMLGWFCLRKTASE